MAKGTSFTVRFRKAGVFCLGIAIGVTATILVMKLTAKTRRFPPPPPDLFEAELQTDQLIPRLDWDDVPLDQAISTLRSLAGAEIYLDCPVLSAARVDLSRHITPHLRNVTLARALARVADQLGDGRTAVSFGTVDGVILLSTPDALPLRPIVRAYDVRDIVSSDLTLEVPPPNDMPPMNPSSEKERGDVLVRMIDGSTETESWLENGGSRAVCAYLAGRLFVCASPHTHRQVEGILKALREELRAAVPPPQPQVAEDEWIAYPVPSPHLKAALWGRVDRLDIDAAIPEACEQIGKRWDVALSLDLDELHAAGLDGNERIRLSMKDVSLLDVLSRLCADPLHGVTLAFEVEENAIRISTRDNLPNWAPTFVYNVRDMIGGVGQMPPTNLDRLSREQLIDRLTQLIEMTVASETWKDNGGHVGALREMFGELVVTQTWENQHKVEEFLARLRAHGMTLHAAQGPATAPTTTPSPAR